MSIATIGSGFTSTADQGSAQNFLVVHLLVSTEPCENGLTNQNVPQFSTASPRLSGYHTARPPLRLSDASPIFLLILLSFATAFLSFYYYFYCSFQIEAAEVLEALEVPEVPEVLEVLDLRDLSDLPHRSHRVFFFAWAVHFRDKRKVLV